jgi:hypothetical protein
MGSTILGAAAIILPFKFLQDVGKCTQTQQVAPPAKSGDDPGTCLRGEGRPPIRFTGKDIG